MSGGLAWSAYYIEQGGKRWNVALGRDHEGLRCAWLGDSKTGQRPPRDAFERKLFADDDPDFSGFATASDLFQAIKTWAAK